MQLIIVEHDPLAQGWWRSLAKGAPLSLSFADDLFVAAAILRSLCDDGAEVLIVADAERVAEAGHAAWRQLRRWAATGGARLLVYSSSIRFFALAQLLGQEVDGFLPRPFGLKELMRAPLSRSTTSAVQVALPFGRTTLAAASI